MLACFFPFTLFFFFCLSLSSRQTTPASSLHLLTFSFVELLLSLPLWSSTGSYYPFCFPNPFREKKKFTFYFGPLLWFLKRVKGSVCVIGSIMGSCFSKITASIFAVWGWLILGWRNVAGGGGFVIWCCLE